MRRRDIPGLDDDPTFPRPNNLATAAFIIEVFTLFAQILGFCAFYCAGPLLAIPTMLGLLIGAYGWHQARLTGVGRDLAAASLVIGAVNLSISVFWVVLLVFYGGFVGLILLLT